MTSEKTEVKVAGDGIREKSGYDTHHGESAIQLLGFFIVSLNTITVEGLFGHVHGRLGCPHVLLTLFVRCGSHE